MDATAATLDVGPTLGAALLGNTFAAALYGMSTLQMYMYFGEGNMDGFGLKGLMVALWLLDTAHIAFTTHAVYDYAVTNYGNPAALASLTWSIAAQLLATSASDMIVRGIFCYRIWILSQRNWIILTGTVSSSLLATARFNSTHSFSAETYEKLHESGWLIEADLAVTLFTDLILAVAQCYLLYTRNGEFKKVQSAIQGIMLYIISTGIFTTLITLGCLIAYVLRPTTLIFVAFYFSMGKLLLNTLLASLNARRRLREKMNDTSIAFQRSTGVNSSRQWHTDDLQDVTPVGPEAARLSYKSGDVTYGARKSYNSSSDSHSEA
ncbi:uncharacterized protein BXZ73DRAFT_104842 [Epithele typhae]|uniref:uncharacterized protein n=1 Tax=Epithele typhae TaxID=378194 RepID=UPI002008D694|nr:uncharacterized protein BXZ73DRAFT_104842 [Epithele typhae]KAH9920027.1 hypothetical protein BXZ73DRAFT_104842 [Epithele typhae]